MLNWLKASAHDERSQPSSNRTALYWLLGLCTVAFLLGAVGAIWKNKILADWSIKAVGALAGGGGLVGAFGQIKSWLVQRETVKATTVTSGEVSMPVMNVPSPGALSALTTAPSPALTPEISIDHPTTSITPKKKPKLNPPPTPEELRKR